MSSMKWLLGACSVIAALAVGCGGSDAVTGDDQNFTGGVTIVGTAKPAADPIASCGPSKPCVDIAVLQLLLASKLQVKVDGNSKSAAIYTATWLAREDGRIAITADPPINGRRNIRILLVEGHETASDEGDAESAVFNFTIANGTIEETEVVAQMTG